MCEWPEGTLKPAIPLTYARSAWMACSIRRVAYDLGRDAGAGGNHCEGGKREVPGEITETPGARSNAEATMPAPWPAMRFCFPTAALPVDLDQGILGFRPETPLRRR